MRLASDLFPPEDSASQIIKPGPDLRISEATQKLRAVDTRRYTYGLGSITDKQLVPIHPGEFVVWGAGVGRGKTAFVERFALHNSSDYKIGFATLDMKPARVHDRCLSKLLGCDLDTVEAHRFGNSDAYQTAMQALREREFYLWHPDTDKEQSITGITEWAEDITADVLIVDYARLIHGWEPGVKAWRIVNYMLRWCEQTSIALILLSQLKGNLESKNRPTENDLGDSTMAAQRADRVNIFHRPHLGHPVRDNIVEILVRKSRYGKVDRVHLGWIGETMDFYELTDTEHANLTCCKWK